MVDSPVHVKLDHSEAVAAKRELLGAEMDLLQLVQRISNYREMRLYELKRKEKLRLAVKKAHFELSALLRKMPHVSGKKEFVRKEKEIIEEGVKRRDIQDKLAEIRRELEKLG
ncbi:MAG: hypothetical protein ABIE22_00885 [archaeon]